PPIPWCALLQLRHRAGVIREKTAINSFSHGVSRRLRVEKKFDSFASDSEDQALSPGLARVNTGFFFASLVSFREFSPLCTWSLSVRFEGRPWLSLPGSPGPRGSAYNICQAVKIRRYSVNLFGRRN